MTVQLRARLTTAALTVLAACGEAAIEPSNESATAQPVAAQALAPDPGAEPACRSTWEAIQRSVFDAKRCNTAACHSADAHAGALSLSGADAYKELIHHATTASLLTPMARVFPGEQARSFLYAKLAAATEHTELPSGAGAPMPVGATPLTAEQLNALKLWIRAGAPETGVVAGTQSLLDCAQPSDADPNKMPPPPEPPQDQGFQLKSGSWSVAPDSETEVCFVTYYDLTQTAPEWAKVPCRLDDRDQTCVSYARRELSQDAQSHHSIIMMYAGRATPTDPSWGKWRCAGGDHAGASCDPLKLGAECGAGSICQTEPVRSIRCIGYGAPDKEVLSWGAGGSQSPVSTDRYPEGVFNVIPAKGLVIWNSHGFNLTQRDASIDQYNDFWYAKPEHRRYPALDIFSAATILIDVPPYEEREYCGAVTLPRYARLSDLASHVHKHSVEFRAWLPPNGACPNGACLPNNTPPDYVSTQFNDPVVRRFDPPPRFDQEDPTTRTIKFCSRFDNGKRFPALLKRASKMPSGTQCFGPKVCVGGAQQGTQCTRDAECGAGSCDACSVQFGVTTEDEMLYLLGTYYVVPPGAE